MPTDKSTPWDRRCDAATAELAYNQRTTGSSIRNATMGFRILSPRSNASRHQSQGGEVYKPVELLEPNAGTAGPSGDLRGLF
jgi:hypothetical protein